MDGVPCLCTDGVPCPVQARLAAADSWCPDAMSAAALQAAYDEDMAKQMWDYAAELTGLQIDPSLS
eukprot:263781-Chlamydomonas_euryale.AAC.1